LGSFLKILIAVCALGILGVIGTVVLFNPAPESDIAPGDTTSAPALVFADESGPDVEPESGGVEEPRKQTGDTVFWIEELTAECEEGEDVGVSGLPLGADWRTTERGVYAESPVTITCVTDGASEGLVFEWSANFGEIEGSGDSIVWVAPDHGAKAQVSVVVRDETGNEETAALDFRVATCDCIYERY